MPDKIKVNCSTVTTFFQSTNSDMNIHDKQFEEGRTIQGQSISNKRTDGGMSKAAKKRFNQRFTLWLSAIEAHRTLTWLKTGKKPPLKQFISFWTLTLPSKQRHEDKELKAILHDFITYCQNVLGLLHTHIWFAEKQQNGNLHFHVIGDGYMAKEKLQVLWNRYMEKHGYIAPFKAKYGHSNPPSTRVDGLKSGIARYLAKEGVKEIQKKGVQGALWKPSQNLSKRKHYIADLTEELEYFEQIQKEKNIQSVEIGQPDKDTGEQQIFAQIFYGKGIDPLKPKYSNSRARLEYYGECFRWLYQKKYSHRKFKK